MHSRSAMGMGGAGRVSEHDRFTLSPVSTLSPCGTTEDNRHVQMMLITAFLFKDLMNRVVFRGILCAPHDSGDRRAPASFVW